MKATDVHPQTTPRAFSEFLKAELKRRGISASELPRRTGLKPGLVSYVLSGRREPDRGTLDALAAALNLPAGYLREKAGQSVEQPEPSPARDDLIAIVQYGSEAQAELLLDLLEHFFSRYEIALKQNSAVKRKLNAAIADLPDEEAQAVLDLLT